MVREGRVLTNVTANGKANFGSNFLVTAYEVGAQVASGSSGTTATVRSGHGFAAGDKFIVGTNATLYNTVTATSATTLTISAMSLSAGDLLVNLGPDTGVASPNYDGSGAVVYTDMDYSTVATTSTVQATDTGRYIYWHKGIAIWELVRSDSITPFALYQDASQVAIGALDVADHATGGSGTVADPWTGWSSFVVEGQPSHFRAGNYSASTLVVPITTSNSAGLTAITGDGSGLVRITLTSATGQFRVYGSGSGTRVLQGVKIEGLLFAPGANNSATGLVSLENFEMECVVDDVFVDVGSTYTVATGIYMLNCSHTTVGSILVRGYTVGGVSLSCTTGLRIYTDDGIQRGNIHFDSVDVVNCTTALKMSSSSGSLNNIDFAEFKAVNGLALDGTLAIDLDTNCEQITFGQLHMELFNNGLDALAVENLVVVNGLASQIHNIANGSGSAFNLVNCDGGRLFCRVDTCYNGFALSGTTTRFLVQKSAAGSITGTYFSDTSSGDNTYLSGTTFTTVSGHPIVFSTPNQDDTVIDLVTTTASQKSPRIRFNPSQANQKMSLEVSIAGVMNWLNNGGSTVHQIDQNGVTLLYSYLRRTVTAAVTASTTHTQAGGTALTSDVNNVSVCANADDAVTLPTAAAGMTIIVMNNGAQNLRIWPALGDDLGAGANTVRAAALAAGSNARFTSYDATNWEEI